MRTRLSAAGSLLFACILLISACGKSEPPHEAAKEPAPATAPATTAVAFVRYISSMDAHSGTDLYFGETKLFSSADAKTGTDYKQVPAERRDFTLRQAGNAAGEPIEKNSEGLGDGKHYTVVAYEDEKGKPVMRVVKDDESAPDAGKAKVRLIHAAPGMEALNVYPAGSKDKLASESRFTTESTWQNADPVKGPLEIRTSDNLRARIPNVQLEAGKLYTFVVTGGAKAKEKLHVTALVDAPSKA